jgi:hypothetical protein
VIVTLDQISTRGDAQLTTPALGGGTHNLTAQYSGGGVPGVLFTAGSTSSAVSETVIPNVAANVSGLVRVTVQHLPGNEALVKVKNKTGQTITGPLYLEITGLPKRVKLLSQHGTVHAHTPKGSPFVTESLTLPPHVTVGFLLHFSDPGHQPFGFGVRVLAGPGAV